MMFQNNPIRLSAICLLLAILAPVIGLADGFNGIWRSQGYGTIFDISGNTVSVYQDVGNTVMLSKVEKAHREKTRFHFEVIPWAYRSTFDMARAGDMLAFTEQETGREILFRRLTELPAKTPRTDDPLTNLEYFLQLFEDLYPAFEDRDVDWKSSRQQLRTEARQDMSQEALFILMSRGLDAIGEDGHIGINGPENHRYSPASPFASPMIRSPLRDDRQALIREKYLAGSFSKTANDKIVYGWIQPGMGYIEVVAVDEMTPNPALDAQLASTDEAIQELLGFFHDAKGMILDLRLNGGGYDAVALMIAGLFADQEHVAFSKRARIQGTQQFTEPRLFLVRPREPNLSSIPLRVLAGPGTASGAEILVMAMMQFPQARRLGEPTMGILADTYLRELPNGWTVRLYSERYFAYDGGAFEAIGIPPDRVVPFTVEHLAARQDTVLEAALTELTTNQ